jgi:5-deoxy-glucuronate isomerase
VTSVATITPRGDAYRGAQVSLDLIEIGADDTVRVSAPSSDEVVVVLLDGSVQWLGTTASRSSVFEQRASAVYVPPAGEVEIVASTASELALAATTAGSCAATGEPFVVTPDDVVAQPRGRPGWQREVHDVVASSMPAQHLLVGETFNASGEWSSFPPHKHDGADGENALEEVYYFRFDQPDGFGFQGLYELDGQERAVFLRNGSVVGIPRGFHPVCAAPGYSLYYLWALAGEHRQLTMFEDPAHRWLNQ